MPRQMPSAKAIWYTDGCKQVRSDVAMQLELMSSMHQGNFLAPLTPEGLVP